MKESISNFSNDYEIHFLLGDVSSRGGIERVTITLANALSALFTVKIISLYKSKEELAFELGESVKLDVIDDGNEVSMYNRQLSLIKGMIFDYCYIQKKSKRLRKLNEGVKVVAVACDVKMTLLARKSNYKKIVAIEHFEYDVINPVLKVIRRILYSNLHHVVSLTEEDKYKYSWLPENKHSIIPNIVEEPQKVTKYNDRGKIVLAVGRLTHQKGFDLLIEAWKHAITNGWTLKIVGEGEEFAKLNSYISENNLDDVFIFPFSTDISKYYNEAKIFVLSSRYEGLGMVLIEALSYGLACISFNCPAGPKTILTQDNGILVEPENVNMLSETISKLINDNEKLERMNKFAPLSIDKFKSKAVTSQWVKIIRELS